MASKRIVTVVGATGKQGGSVAECLLNTGDFEVRGTSRRDISMQAKILKSKGVHVVACDIKDKARVKQAFNGSYGVFAVTNFWDPEINPEQGGTPQLEEREGRVMAEAALDCGVQHYVWSTLDNCEQISGGRFKVQHFTYKAKVEQYIRTELKALPSSFVSPGFYMQNIIAGPLAPKTTADGLELAWPLHPSAAVPLFDVTDTGPIVRAVFSQRLIGQKVLMASEMLTGPQIAAIFQKVTGKPTKFTTISYEMFESKEIAEMFAYINEFGYFQGGKPDLETAKKLHPGMRTFEQWLRESKFLGPEPSDQS